MAFYRVNVVKTTFSRRFNNQETDRCRERERAGLGGDTNLAAVTEKLSAGGRTGGYKRAPRCRPRKQQRGRGRGGSDEEAEVRGIDS